MVSWGAVANEGGREITLGSLVAVHLATVALSGLPEEPTFAWGGVGADDTRPYARGAWGRLEGARVGQG